MRKGVQELYGPYGKSARGEVGESLHGELLPCQGALRSEALQMLYLSVIINSVDMRDLFLRITRKIPSQLQSADTFLGNSSP